MIFTAKIAKETLESLCVHFEGTNAVRESKLELITIRFENLRMSEEETISDFTRKLCDRGNESFALGEKISKEKLVKKVLRYLPQRFAYKVAAIREAKDLKKKRLEELLGLYVRLK